MHYEIYALQRYVLWNSVLYLNERMELCSTLSSPLVGSRARPTSHQTLSPTTCTSWFHGFLRWTPLDWLDTVLRWWQISFIFPHLTVVHGPPKVRHYLIRHKFIPIYTRSIFMLRSLHIYSSLLALRIRGRLTDMLITQNKLAGLVTTLWLLYRPSSFGSIHDIPPAWCRKQRYISLQDQIEV